MKFYEAIVAHYDEIFPLGVVQLNLMSKIAGEPPAKILDLACGTGSYALALAQKGYDVTASDFDLAMVQKLNDKNRDSSLQVNVKQFNMKDVAKNVSDSYDEVICVGNSIVHLESFDEVQQFLKGIRKILKPSGKVLIQIVNYDRVLYHLVTKLPTIVNNKAKLSFKRNYIHDYENHRIRFNGVLEVGDFTSSETTVLLPIKSENMVDMLKLAGFKKIAIYGGFDLSPFKALESMSLVVLAE